MSPIDARRRPLPHALDSTERQASVATTEPRVALVIRSSVTETDVPSRGEAHAAVVTGTSRATWIERVAGDLHPERRQLCTRIRRPRDSGLPGRLPVTNSRCTPRFQRPVAIWEQRSSALFNN